MLDSFSSEQVWYAGVPGAGGDDAIFVLGNPDVDLKQLIKTHFTSSRPNLAVLPVDLEKW